MAAIRDSRRAKQPEHPAGVLQLFGDYGGLAKGRKRLGDQLSLSWPSWSPSIEIQIDRFLTGEMRHHEAREPLSSMGTDLARLDCPPL